MSKNSPHLGKWYKKVPDGDFEEITILEVDGDICRAANKNFTIQDLQRTYLRKEALAPDPFAIAPIDKSLVKPKLQPQTATTTETSVNTNVQNSSGNTLNAAQVIPAKTPQHKFILDAIELSNEDESIEFSLTMKVPCKLEVLKTISQAFSIDTNITAEVISEMIQKENSAAITEALVKSIVSKLGGE